MESLHHTTVCMTFSDAETQTHTDKRSQQPDHVAVYSMATVTLQGVNINITDTVMTHHSYIFQSVCDHRDLTVAGFFLQK